MRLLKLSSQKDRTVVLTVFPSSATGGALRGSLHPDGLGGRRPGHRPQPPPPAHDLRQQEAPHRRPPVFRGRHERGAGQQHSGLHRCRPLGPHNGPRRAADPSGSTDPAGGGAYGVRAAGGPGGYAFWVAGGFHGARCGACGHDAASATDAVYWRNG